MSKNPIPHLCIVGGPTPEYTSLFGYIQFQKPVTTQWCLEQYGHMCHKTEIPHNTSKFTFYTHHWLGGYRFREVVEQAHLPKASAVLLCYQINSRQSFDDIEMKYDEIKTKHLKPDTTVVLIGIQCDSEDERAVTEQEGAHLASQLQLEFFEVSTSTGNNIFEAISAALKLDTIGETDQHIDVDFEVQDKPNKKCDIM